MKKLVSKEYIDRWWLLAVVRYETGSATAELSSQMIEMIESKV